MMAVAEKRRMLRIEIEARSGKMETIGDMPMDVGRNYILKRIEKSLLEDKDDTSKLGKLDTAERKC